MESSHIFSQKGEKGHRFMFFANLSVDSLTSWLTRRQLVFHSCVCLLSFTVAHDG